MQNATAIRDKKPTTTTTAAAASVIYYFLIPSLSILFVILLFKSHSPPPSSAASPPPDPFLFPNRHRHLFFNHQPTSPSDPAPPPPPSIAYFITGSANDSGRILRLLLSAYHPRNQYLLHLDLSASRQERESLAVSVQSVPVFRAAQNVNVIGKADLVSPKGSSCVSNVLHGAAVLLKVSNNWDWFVNLSADDYPLVTQDDLLHILSYLPKDLNFVNHTSYIGWRESRRLKPVIIDPGLFHSVKSEMFYGTQQRQLPDAYQLFIGSQSGFLSRNFLEFCIVGTENLPRTLLMYLTNTLSALSLYFSTVLCNSPEFNRTIVNHNLQYSAFDMKREPRPLNSSDFNGLIHSGAAFASPFLRDELLLDLIDQELLGRARDKPVPGGWCLGQSDNDTCAVWGDADVLRPGPGARRLEKTIVDLLMDGKFQSHQCVFE